MFSLNLAIDLRKTELSSRTAVFFGFTLDSVKAIFKNTGGAEGIRTPDLLNAIQFSMGWFSYLLVSVGFCWFLLLAVVGKSRIQGVTFFTLLSPVFCC